MRRKQKMGLLLHRKMGYHIAFMYMINIILFMVMVSLFEVFGQKIDLNVTSLFVGVTLFTLLELIIKYPLYMYFYKEIVYSGGVVAVLIQVGILKLMDVLVSHFSFGTLSNLIIFSICFSGVRFLVINVVRKYTYEA